jgi:hypothetical protein
MLGAMLWPSWTLLIALLLLAAGCRHNFREAAADGASDRSSIGHEGAPREANVGDRAGDLGPHDLGPHDRTGDLPAPSPDLPRTDACQAGFHELFYDAAKAVVVCTIDSTVEIQQCDAKNACGNGWSVCKASQYQSRYGTATLPDPRLDQAWIAGCVRETGGTPHAPNDLLCPSCDGSYCTIADVLWFCGTGTSLGMPLQGCNLGLMSLVEKTVADSCTRAGMNAQGNEGLWLVRDTSLSLKKVLCCQ